MFRDEAMIEVVAGKGGDGVVSFRREKSVPLGGPDGGDGGAGGSVLLRADSSLNSLLELGRRHRYAARDGAPGGPKNMSGRSAEDLTVRVPVGTQIFDSAHGNLLSDLTSDDQEIVVAQGGKGGLGNQHFATSVRQTPRIATQGRDGERRNLKLVLKLFAEVGLVGLPNAGKSTLLSCITAATPRIADYPFTTLVPHVGIAEVGDFDTLVIADLPGLIEGASEGLGLGHRFLKHVERCKVLLHLVDVSSTADPDPVRAYEVIEAELAAFSSDLAGKPRLLVATKVEEDSAGERIARLEERAGQEALRISAVLGLGLADLLRKARLLARASSA